MWRTRAGVAICAGQMTISFPSGFYYFTVYPGQKAQEERLEEKSIIFEKIENIYHCLGLGTWGALEASSPWLIAQGLA